MWQRSSDCVRLLWLLPDEAARLAGRSTSNTAPDALDLNAADVECGGEDVAGTVADDAYAAPLASFAGLCCASPYWLFLGFVLKNNPPGPLLTTVQRRFSGTTISSITQPLRKALLARSTRFSQLFRRCRYTWLLLVHSGRHVHDPGPGSSILWRCRATRSLPLPRYHRVSSRVARYPEARLVHWQAAICDISQDVSIALYRVFVRFQQDGQAFNGAECAKTASREMMISSAW